MFQKHMKPFLREIEKLNMEETLPQNAVLVSMDVTGLYTNININEGIDCVREILRDSEVLGGGNIKLPSEYIVRLLEFIMEFNIFKFNENYAGKLLEQLWEPALHLLSPIFSWL